MLMATAIANSGSNGFSRIAAAGQLAFLYVMRIATIPGAERLRLDQAGDPAADTLPGNAVRD